MSFQISAERGSIPNDLPDVPRVRKSVDKRTCVTRTVLAEKQTSTMPAKSLDPNPVKDKRTLRGMGFGAKGGNTKVKRPQKSGAPNAWTDVYSGTSVRGPCPSE